MGILCEYKQHTRGLYFTRFLSPSAIEWLSKGPSLTSRDLDTAVLEQH